MCEFVALRIDQFEFSPYEGLADAFVLLRNASALHALFLIFEVDNQTGTGGEEEDAGFP